MLREQRERMYVRARSLADALDALARGQASILSGGTDFFPALVDQPRPARIVDISRIDELRGITQTENEIRIGAAVTWGEIASAKLPSCFKGLQLAAREVGSIQIQNVATLAGNLCNASPAADGVPPLLCLDAQIEIASQQVTRRLPLEAFILGNRKTALRAGELVTALAVPSSSLRGASHFFKLGARRYLVISIAMVAAKIAAGSDGCIEDARVAIGSCSAAALRLRDLERDLAGVPAVEASAAIEPRHLDLLTPIDDARGSAGYRLDAALHLIRRTLDACVKEKRIG